MTVIAALVGEETLHVDVDITNAPGLSAALLACAPHDTVAVHTQTAGAEFCLPVPFFHWHENRREPRTGDVGYASFGNYICFYYGEMSSADGPTNVVGRVRDVRTLQRLGLTLLEEGAARARLLLPGSDHPRPSVPFQPGSAFLEAIRVLYHDTHRDPPASIDELRSTPLPGMGNIAGRLQASGLLLGFGEALFLLRGHSSNESMDVLVLTSMVSHELLRYARWLELVGMCTVARHLRVIASSCVPRADRVELVSGL